MRPAATAASSAAPMVMENHMASVSVSAPAPVSSGRSAETSPPPPASGCRLCSASKRNDSGPRLETTIVSGLVIGDHGRVHGRADAVQCRPEHVDGLGAQFVQGPVAVDALAQVDLGQDAGADVGGHVDQQGDLDAVAVGEPDLLEHPPVGRRLPGQRLADLGELGEEQLEHRPGHQLGHPAAPGRARRAAGGCRSPSPGRRRGGGGAARACR